MRRARVSLPTIRRAIVQIAEKKYYEVCLWPGDVGAIAGFPGTGLAGLTWRFSSVFGPDNALGLYGGAANPAQGVTVSTRTGNKIHVTQISFRVTITPLLPDTMKAGSSCRFVVYHNHEHNNSATPPAGPSIFSPDGLNGFRNYDKLKAFSIMKDGMHSMAIISGTQNANPAKIFQFNIFPKKRIDFSSATAALSAVVKDDYGFGFCADAAGCCAMNVFARVYFTDA